jgi:hypothetical protein
VRALGPEQVLEQVQSLRHPDHGYHRTDLHRLTLSGADLGHNARNGRRHFGIDLVGRHFEERFIRGNGVAHILEPLRDGALGHGFTKLGRVTSAIVINPVVVRVRSRRRRSAVEASPGHGHHRFTKQLAQAGVRLDEFGDLVNCGFPVHRKVPAAQTARSPRVRPYAHRSLGRRVHRDVER